MKYFIKSVDHFLDGEGREIIIDRVVNILVLGFNELTETLESLDTAVHVGTFN